MPRRCLDGKNSRPRVMRAAFMKTELDENSDPNHFPARSAPAPLRRQRPQL